jgi:Uma2 family endonuclease
MTRLMVTFRMSPSHRVKTPATYDDLLALPEHVVGEIVDGELYVSPRPALRHAVASSALGGELGPPFQRGRGGPGGWWILDEPELHLGTDVLVPDLAGWRRVRMPVIPDTAFLTLAPDWVCEVVSPKTGRLDRRKKLPVSAREGIGHLWLVDPLQRTLEVLRLDDGRWTIVATHGDDDCVRAEPFEAVGLELSALWTDGAAE